MIRKRCAIYTRKSTEEGLEQSFNSLDAQREACAAYILSQRHEGWMELSDRYDDGGFSGGSMERPGLQRLLADVSAGRVDVIAVYKVDRLTRALSDFAKMVEIFDGAGVSFVSVTQAFNTTSSMGRLTLNVLLSFAQFEREVTAERIRDKVAASKRKGIWMGGAVPTGYDVTDKALVVNAIEADAVRTIFREYLVLGSVPALRSRLGDLGIISKRRTDRHGRTTGGKGFSTGALYYLLRNPVYFGKVRHRGALHEGQHNEIIDEAVWMQVQDLLDGNGGGAISTERGTARRWLDGLLFDRRGRPMRTTYASKSISKGSVRRSKRYWYYVSKSGDAADDLKPDRLPADAIEDVVRETLLTSLADRSRLAEAMTGAGAGASAVADALRRAETLLSMASVADKNNDNPGIASLVHRIDLRDGALRIALDLSPLIDRSDQQVPLALPIDVPIFLRQSGRNRPIVLFTDDDIPRRDPELVALVADARRWRDDLLEGRAASVSDLTKREQVRPGTISRVLPLAWLAPDIAQAILEGRQPADLSARRLRDLPNLPLDWREQRRILGFTAA